MNQVAQENTLIADDVALRVFRIPLVYKRFLLQKCEYFGNNRDNDTDERD